MLRVTDQIVNPRQPPLPEAEELASGGQSDLTPSTQGMIFILLHGCDVIRIFKLCLEERGVRRVLLCSLKMRMMSHQV